MSVVVTLMQVEMFTTLIPARFVRALLIWIFIASPGAALRAQEIHIRVLNGRNGHPITQECLNVWIGTRYGPHMVAATDADGVVVLRLVNNELVAENGCRGWPARASRPSGTDAIALAGDKYVDCQEYGKVVPGEPATADLLKDIMPSYSIKKILESGVSAANKCGKFRGEAMPGELIFFVRTRSFLERTRQ